MLDYLPDPKVDKTGWPWTLETPPEVYEQGKWYPKIAVVTPSFNQGKFIEETIRSVLLQNYPNLEYYVVDGGSTDETVEILKKYDRWITWWVSEPDAGQTAAINKGFKKVKDAITGWINSDDLYLPGALWTVSQQFDASTDFLYGECQFLNQDGSITPGKGPEENLKVLYASDFPYPSQPSCFWRSSLFEELGYLDERFQFAMDFEFFVRVGLNKNIKKIADQLTLFRLHSESKSSNWQHVHDHDRRILLSRVINSISVDFPDIRLPALYSYESYPVTQSFSVQEKKSVMANAFRTLLLIDYTAKGLKGVREKGKIIKMLDQDTFNGTYVRTLYRRSQLISPWLLGMIRKIFRKRG